MVSVIRAIHYALEPRVCNTNESHATRAVIAAIRACIGHADSIGEPRALARGFSRFARQRVPADGSCLPRN